MRSRLPVVLLVLFIPLIVLAFMAAQGLQAEPAAPAMPNVPTASGPITVDVALDLGDGPVNLDPSRASGLMSLNVIEQLFVGLVTTDERSGDVVPELASDWNVSADNSVYTFTLRGDAAWSDGRRLTAGDVRYGFLRSLEPGADSPLGYNLWDILNAQAYSEGNVTADQVGIDVLDDETVRFRLAGPVGHFLSVLTIWPARPLPHWTIETYGEAWTAPGNIVTSGPYTLREHVPDEYLILEKNPAYHGAAGVQIEQVRMWRYADADASWQAYLDGELDTSSVPVGATVPPEIARQVAKKPRPCSYHYGFSQSEPPFDNVLVRKAFSSATDRHAVVNYLGGGESPALTYTPPGMFGHVDGYAEGVGHPYNLVQAQQYLADAGYPGGVGLPPITLWFNDSAGHQAIAEMIRDQWYATLNVSVTLAHLPWDDYLDQLATGESQVWRLGWCADYLDAYNFLYGGTIARDRYGNWSNATYDNLIHQSRIEQDPNARKALFKQAEEILVETDAMMIPIYFYGSHVASKPYLARTYPATSYHVAYWRIRTQATIDGSGGSLASYDGRTQLTMPAGALGQATVLTHAPVSGAPHGGGKITLGRPFSLTAVYSATGAQASLLPGQSYDIVFNYDEADLGRAAEETLAFYYWDGASWQREDSSAVDAIKNRVMASPDHFSIWSVMGVRDDSLITLAMSLGEEPELDPALAGGYASFNAVEQLFAGLTDVDDESGAVIPELATSWLISVDNRTFTFTLRSDMKWSDGNPVTAGDVRYGILRSLDPAVGGPLSYVLYVIENAWDYREGNITDPDLVGVTAVDSTTLRFDLEEPAAHLPAILAMAPAKPMPQWAIDAHGAAWTDPGNIVTSGPYLLVERVDGSHLTLEKNPDYHAAGDVQIQRVIMHTGLDAGEAWRAYLGGRLDTAELPEGTPLDPALAGEVQFRPTAGTYYYGFSVAQEPFDDVLVRKAFASAINRPELAATVRNGYAQPALTYTPPGFVGHVDGYAAGVGLPYNPSQAQAWLAAAGYPGGAGLPPITLHFNESAGHRAIAAYARDAWQSTLGVTVTLESRPWSEYLNFIRNGDAQVFRLGWFADYQDGYNFIADGIGRNRFGDWSNAAYDNLLNEIAAEMDLVTRASKFQQAEEILVETDAVMAPLYYYGARTAAKPYLERTYSPVTYDISQWRIASTGTATAAAGGQVSSYDGKTTISAGAGVFTGTAAMQHQPLAAAPPVGQKMAVGAAFEMGAVYEASGRPAVPQAAYEVVVRYSDTDRGVADESTLALHHWDGAEWVKEATSAVDAQANLVRATPTHFSTWAVLGEANKSYLPMLIR